MSINRIIKIKLLFFYAAKLLSLYAFLSYDHTTNLLYLQYLLLLYEKVLLKFKSIDDPRVSIKLEFF